MTPVASELNERIPGVIRLSGRIEKYSRTKPLFRATGPRLSVRVQRDVLGRSSDYELSVRDSPTRVQSNMLGRSRDFGLPVRDSPFEYREILSDETVVSGYWSESSGGRILSRSKKFRKSLTLWNLASKIYKFECALGWSGA